MAEENVMAAQAINGIVHDLDIFLRVLGADFDRQQFQIQKSMIAKCRWRLKSRRHKQNLPATVKASIESTKVDFACIAAVSTAKLEC
jgi:hypothetical protein